MFFQTLPFKFGSSSQDLVILEQDKKKMEGDVKVDEEEMLPGSIMNSEKSVSESTSREVGFVRTGWFS